MGFAAPHFEHLAASLTHLAQDGHLTAEPMSSKDLLSLSATTMLRRCGPGGQAGGTLSRLFIGRPNLDPRAREAYHVSWAAAWPRRGGRGAYPARERDR